MKTKTENEHHMPGIGNNKRQFLEAVHLLAPGNKFIHAAARHVPQDMLPAIAGVAALEFASTLDLLCKSWRLRRPIEARRRSGRRSCGRLPERQNQDQTRNQAIHSVGTTQIT